MWIVTRVWDSAGMVSLVQVFATAAVLGLVARRLIALGVSRRLAIGTVLVVSALPMVGITTITLWKDVPYSLAMVWAFAELLGLARDPDGFWTDRWTQVRLGSAFALMWLFRHNGMYTVLLVLAVLAIAYRHRLRSLRTLVAVTVGLGALIPMVLAPLLSVRQATIEPAQVFASDVAASYHHEPGNFSPSDLELLEAIAPLEVWDDRYSCLDSTPLVFDPEYAQNLVA